MRLVGCSRRARSARAAPRTPTAGGCAPPRRSGRSARATAPSTNASSGRHARTAVERRASASAIGGSSTRPRSFSASMRKLAAARGEDQRRIDEAHVPARVAARDTRSSTRAARRAACRARRSRARSRRRWECPRPSGGRGSRRGSRRGRGHDRLSSSCEEPADSGGVESKSRPDGAAPFVFGSVLDARVRDGAALRGPATTTARDRADVLHGGILAGASARCQAARGRPPERVTQGLQPRHRPVTAVATLRGTGGAAQS